MQIKFFQRAIIIFPTNFQQFSYEFFLIFLFTEKRASPQNGSAINQIQELKGSPPAKKVVPRRVQTSTTTTTTTTTASNAQKSPLKGRIFLNYLMKFWAAKWMVFKEDAGI